MRTMAKGLTALGARARRMNLPGLTARPVLVRVVIAFSFLPEGFLHRASKVIQTFLAHFLWPRPLQGDQPADEPFDFFLGFHRVADRQPQGRGAVNTLLAEAVHTAM